MSYTLKKGEVAIVIRPQYEDGEFSGSVATGLVISSETKDPIAMQASMEVALTMAAAPLFVEAYPDSEEAFDEYRHVLLQDLFPEQYEESKKAVAESREYDKKDNVLTLKAWTKTEGNA